MARDQQTRTREIRVRRVAARRGVELAKSRRRDPEALDYGRWTVDDPRRGVHLVGLTLAEVEAHLGITR